ncbi:MAG: UvrD-helicase domain-containing protein [Bacilli bacterium]
MDKKIILAKAGSGKTFHICKTIDVNQRNLILAFTNQNISNIHRELKDSNNGLIPSKTVVMTFHSFVYHTFIRPYELIYSDFFKMPNFTSQGVEINYQPEPQSINGKANNKYISKDKICHYYTKNMNLVYVSRMSELPLYANSKSNNLLTNAFDYLNKFYDCIYIDEVQDFRNYDWDLLEKIIKGMYNMTLVGDFYQHSVSGTNNSGRPFDKYKTEEKYLKYLSDLKLNVDITTLPKSRRCPSAVSNYVSKKTGVDLNTHEDCTNVGEIKYIESVEHSIRILKNNQITKLVWENAKKYPFNAINWSYSKGDTYPAICVVLTKDLSKNFFKDDFIMKDGITKNKLYVALTRTAGDLYIMSSQQFEDALKQIE